METGWRWEVKSPRSRSRVSSPTGTTELPHHRVPGLAAAPPPVNVTGTVLTLHVPDEPERVFCCKPMTASPCQQHLVQILPRGLPAGHLSCSSCHPGLLNHCRTPPSLLRSQPSSLLFLCLEHIFDEVHEHYLLCAVFPDFSSGTQKHPPPAQCPHPTPSPVSSSASWVVAPGSF